MFSRNKQIFVLSFENNDDRVIHAGSFLPKVEINDCNLMIHQQIAFDQPLKSNMRTYHNI